MASNKTSLDKTIAYVGILVGIAGIALTLWLFFVFDGLLDSIHQTSLNQVDTVISVLHDSVEIVNYSAASVDSLGEFASNTSTALQYSADALGGMSIAVSGLADSIGSIPYMPKEAVAPLYSTSEDVSAMADSIEETAASMETASGDVLSATLGLQALQEDIENSIGGLEKTKDDISNMHLTAKTGLILGTILLILVFALNSLMFYRQLRQ